MLELNNEVDSKGSYLNHPYNKTDLTSPYQL